MGKVAEIKLKVSLDEQKIPEKISWEASDGPSNGSDAKAMFLYLLDEERKDTLRFELWTKSLQVYEMDRFMFQALRSLSDSYFRATQNKELASEMQKFVQYFGEKTQILGTE